MLVNVVSRSLGRLADLSTYGDYNHLAGRVNAKREFDFVVTTETTIPLDNDAEFPSQSNNLLFFELSAWQSLFHSLR